MIYILAQSLFRKKKTTVDNIFILDRLINHFINNNKPLYACFIDFTKAFDYLLRDNNFYKLFQVGVSGNMLNFIKSMYSNVKSRVK